MRILVCGSRDWTDDAAIYRELSAFPADTVLIHGNCRGADQIAGRIGDSLGFEVVPVAADWTTHGKAAGPLRNADMLKLKPDLVLAFTANLEASRGTRNMVGLARAAGVEVRVLGGCARLISRAARTAGDAI